jgi:hypothetical protein
LVPNPHRFDPIVWLVLLILSFFPFGVGRNHQVDDFGRQRCGHLQLLDHPQLSITRSPDTIFHAFIQYQTQGGTAVAVTTTGLNGEGKPDLIIANEDAAGGSGPTIWRDTASVQAEPY